MSIARFIPPLDYLREASRTSLQSFELARLNHAANLRREIGALIDQWVHETSEATLARYLIDHHASLHDFPQSPTEPISTFPEPAIDLLPLPGAASPKIIPAPPRFSNARTISQKPQKRKRIIAG